MPSRDLNSEPKIFLKLFKFIVDLNEFVRNLPKHYKYSLGQETMDMAWRCLDLVLEANFYYTPRIKKQKINELSLTFDKLKLRIRMFQELNLIKTKKFQMYQLHYLKNIGGMIGGWIKWADSLE